MQSANEWQREARNNVNAFARLASSVSTCIIVEHCTPVFAVAVLKAGLSVIEQQLSDAQSREAQGVFDSLVESIQQL